MTRACVMGLAALVIAGCGDGGQSLVPVTGKVTLDGKPLALKSVQFIPEEGTPGQGAGGSTDNDGNYSLISVRPGATRDFPGVPAGKYRVVVSEPMFPLEAAPAPPSPKEGEPAPAIAPPAPKRGQKQTIPQVYTSKESTPLKVDVPEKGGVLNLGLTSKQ